MEQARPDIPADLLMRVLGAVSEPARRAVDLAGSFMAERATLRALMAEAVSIRDRSDEIEAASPLAVSAVDGAMVVARRRFGDLCAAVAVEAQDLPPGADPVPPEPGDVWIETAPKAAGNDTVVSGIMATMESSLAARSSAPVVMLDGSFISSAMAVGKAFQAARSMVATGRPSPLVAALRDRVGPDFLEQVLAVYTSGRHVAVPKYSTSNEFAVLLPGRGLERHDGRTLASLALAPGEVTGFLDRGQDGGIAPRDLQGGWLDWFDRDRYQRPLLEALSAVRTVYYRPHAWSQAFRIDLSGRPEEQEAALPAVLRAIRDTTRTPALMEPLPMWMADQWAKQGCSAAPEALDIASMGACSDPDIKLMIALQHRTEG
jgi:hypothetical protein